jgi:hypothetical protein
MEKNLKTILTEMCSRVGVTFEDVDFQENAWYTKHKWTAEEEASFEDWLSNFLFTNKEARKELLKHTVNSRKQCDTASKEFVVNYGWSYKEKEKTI